VLRRLTGSTPWASWTSASAAALRCRSWRSMRVSTLGATRAEGRRGLQVEAVELEPADLQRQAAVDAHDAVVVADEVDVVGDHRAGHQGNRQQRDHRQSYPQRRRRERGGAAAGADGSLGVGERDGVVGRRLADLGGPQAVGVVGGRCVVGGRLAAGHPLVEGELLVACGRPVERRQHSGLGLGAGHGQHRGGGFVGGRVVDGRAVVVAGRVEAQHDDGDVVVAAFVLGLADELAGDPQGSSTAARTAAIVISETIE